MHVGFYNKSFIKSPWASYLFQASLGPGVKGAGGGGGGGLILIERAGLFNLRKWGVMLLFQKTRRRSIKN